jgi:hypothetical protein
MSLLPSIITFVSLNGKHHSRLAALIAKGPRQAQIAESLIDKQSQMAERSAMRPNYALFPAKLCFKSQEGHRKGGDNGP